MKKLGMLPASLAVASLLAPAFFLLAASGNFNLVKNPDFEIGAQGWDGEIRWPTAGGKAFIDSEQGYQSSHSLLLRNSDPGFNRWISVEQKLELLPETKYEVEGYIRNRGLNADFAGAVIHYRNNKGQLYSNEILVNIIEPRSEWQRFTASFITPSPSYYSYLMLALKGQGEVWFDRFSVARARNGIPFYAPAPHTDRDRLKPRLAPGPYVRVERVGENWWLVKPDGTILWDRGVNWVAYPQGYGEQLNPQYAQVVRQAHLSPVVWAKDMMRQLKEWGFTSAAGWAGFNRMEDNEVKLAGAEQDGFFYYYTFNFTDLPGGSRFFLKSAYERPIPGGTERFPDPFNPDWRREAEKLIARAAKAFKDDKRFIGYFVGNEPSLASPMVPHLYNYIWSEYSSKEFLIWLKARYGGDIKLLNRAWSSLEHRYAFSNFEGVLVVKPQPVSPEDPVRKELQAFEKHLVKEYVDFTYGTIKKYDPNHLVISPRLETDFNINYRHLDLLSRYDLVAANSYYHGEGGYWLEGIEKLRKLYERIGRPIIITEWGGGKLIGQRTNAEEGAYQEARARLYENGILQLAGLPFTVGAHWFMLYDVLGYNTGLLNSQAKPYEPLVKAASRVNNQLDAIMR